MKSFLARIAALGLALAAFSDSTALAGPSFDAVKGRGQLICGVNTGLFGFSAPDDKGVWKGIDVDVCRAVAAAMFGDPAKVSYRPLTTQQRFTALQSGEIDLLSRNTTWALGRDTDNGLNFAPVVFYDGQGFMVPKSLRVTNAMELSGATICVQPGTTTELNVADFFRANKLEFKPVVIDKVEETTAAYLSGRCDALTSDSSQLAAIRTNQTSNPADHVILTELISKEPLAPAVRQGDDQWFDVVKWVIFAMFEAEERGIGSANVDEMLKSNDPSVQRLLGVNPDMGPKLGLDPKWAYNVIKQVGNYGEIFERNVGMSSKLQMERGLNALWTKGGLMYAPPIR